MTYAILVWPPPGATSLRAGRRPAARGDINSEDGAKETQASKSESHDDDDDDKRNAEATPIAIVNTKYHRQASSIIIIIIIKTTLIISSNNHADQTSPRSQSRPPPVAPNLLLLHLVRHIGDTGGLHRLQHRLSLLRGRGILCGHIPWYYLPHRCCEDTDAIKS